MLGIGRSRHHCDSFQRIPKSHSMRSAYWRFVTWQNVAKMVNRFSMETGQETHDTNARRYQGMSINESRVDPIPQIYLYARRTQSTPWIYRHVCKDVHAKDVVANDPSKLGERFDWARFLCFKQVLTKLHRLGIQALSRSSARPLDQQIEDVRQRRFTFKRILQTKFKPV